MAGFFIQLSAMKGHGFSSDRIKRLRDGVSLSGSESPLGPELFPEILFLVKGMETKAGDAVIHLRAFRAETL